MLPRQKKRKDKQNEYHHWENTFWWKWPGATPHLAIHKIPFFVYLFICVWTLCVTSSCGFIVFCYALEFLLDSWLVMKGRKLIWCHSTAPDNHIGSNSEVKCAIALSMPWRLSKTTSFYLKWAIGEIIRQRFLKCGFCGFPTLTETYLCVISVKFTNKHFLCFEPHNANIVEARFRRRIKNKLKCSTMYFYRSKDES